MITSASFQKNNVLIEPIKQDQRANEREACAELESKSLHANPPSDGRIISLSDFGGLHSITYVSIRGNLYPGPHQEVAREARLMFPRERATFFPSRTEDSIAASESVASIGVIGSRLRLVNKAVNHPVSRTSYDATSRRTLAADVIVGSHFYSGTHFQSSRFNENPSRNDSYMLPGGVCRVRVSSSHVEQHHMGIRYEHPRSADKWSERNERAQ